MIPELPPSPRAELEAKVTALLLGELTDDEAANVSALIAQDPELARLRNRLALTLDFVRETSATPAGATPAQPAPLKISPERREKLLASFKTIRPKEFENARRQTSSLIGLVATVALIGILASLLLPRLSNGKISAKKRLELSQQAQEVATAPAALSQPVSRENKIVLPQDEIPSSPAPAPIGPAVDTLGIQEANEVQNRKESITRGQMPSTGTLFANNTVQHQSQNQNAAETSGSGLDNKLSNSERRNLGYGNSDPDRSGRGGRALADKLPENSASLASREAYAPESVGPQAATLYDNGVAQNSVSAPAVTPPAMGDTHSINRTVHANFTRPGIVSSLPAATHGATAMMADRDNAGVDWGSSLVPKSRSLTPISGKATPTAADGATINLTKAGVVPEAPGVESLHNTPSDRSIASAPVAVASPAMPPATVALNSAGSVAFAFPSEKTGAGKDLTDAPLPQSALPSQVPQGEVLTSSNAFTTFSLNLSDVAFRLAQASLQNGVMPEAASMRTEEFINAFDYRDPEPAPGAPVGFAWERAGDPFAHHRDFLRFSIKAAAQGRQAGRPLNLVLLLDKSGSMERADRVEIIAQALHVLASQLQPDDTLSVVVFARRAHLFVDGVSGKEAEQIAKKLRDLTPEGGTNLEEAMKLAYATAMRHYLAKGENCVVLMTDGAANLGNVDPNVLKKSVEENNKQGIALDCFGVGWDGYNDNLLETLSRAGHGRYGFINTPEEAATEFAGKLAGALRVAAADVKVQVEFNPRRVISYRQIGYAKDQLQKEDFRNNDVKAAQISAAESGTALYTVEINAAGEGDIGTVHVRFRVPGTQNYEEHEWTVPYTGASASLDKASSTMRLAATAAAFCEWLAHSPYAVEVTPVKLIGYLNGVPQSYGADERPAQLLTMILQARSVSGK